MKAKKLTNIIEEKQGSFKAAWSNVWSVFTRDIKRILKRSLLIIVLLGALLLPCLYAWLTITANWDPYGNTKNLKIAVVNNDEGVESSVGGHLAIGDELEKQLSTNNQLGWTFTDESDAIRKVESGEFYAAIVLPKDFSNSIANIIVNGDKRDFAKADYYVNERENGAAVKVADTGASTLEKQINEKFVGKVTEVVAGKVVELSSAVVADVANSGNTMSDRISRVASNVSGLNNVIKKGQYTMSQAQDTISLSINVMTDIKNESDNLMSSVDAARQEATSFQNTIISLIETHPELSPYLGDLLRMISDLNTSLSDMSSALFAISFSSEEIISNLNEASYMLTETGVIAVDFSNKLTKVHDLLVEVSSTIQANLTNAPELVKMLTNANAQTVGAFMSQPVKLQSEVLNKIENNGTGITPFFTNLAIWVLGIVLIALFRTEVEPPKRKGWNAKQAYVSRAMLFSFAALISGLFVSLGDLIIGIQCENPIMFVISCMITAFVYVNIIYMLAACFKHVGRAIACILVIMQIPGSSGMFPIQLMPQGFQNIFPFLPFTYGINALRECIVNINWLYWFLDIVALGIFFAIFFLIGLYARESLRGINKLFDDELAKNTIMNCEPEDHIAAKANTVETVVETLSDNEEAMTVASAIDNMRVKYKKRSRYGLLVLAIGPTALLVTMSIVMLFIDVSINVKLIWMTLWMLSVIAIATYVIVYEYKYKQFKKNEKDSLLKAAELSEAKSNA